MHYPCSHVTVMSYSIKNMEVAHLLAHPDWANDPTY